MAWNEPGKNQGNKDNQNHDPWSGRKKSTKPKDLDDALNNLQKKFSKLMKSKSLANNKIPKINSIFTAGLIALIVIGIWFFTGFFVVQSGEKSVILRWGKYYNTVGTGLHWIPRFMDSENTVNVQKIYSYTYPGDNDALILTKDQNMVAVAITVQYKINNPEDYLFNVVNPISSMQQASASALQQVVSQMDIDSILTTGREQLQQDVKKQLEALLQTYQSGLEITNVLLKSAQAPAAVRSAFDDAVKAKEDEKSYINQAQAYVMKVVPNAESEAKRITETAKAYRLKTVLNAKADVASFIALLPEYQLAPNVTRARMYFDTMQQLLTKSSKILVDTTGGQTNNLLYLPLEKLLSSKESNIQSLPKKTQSNKVTTPTTSATSTEFNSTRPTREQALEYGNLGGGE